MPRPDDYALQQIIADAERKGDRAVVALLRAVQAGHCMTWSEFMWLTHRGRGLPREVLDEVVELEAEDHDER